MTESRALKVFLGAIKTEATKKAYMYWLKKYADFRGVTDFDNLARYTLDEIEVNVEDYLMSLIEKKIPRGTIEAMIYPVFLFYQMNRISLNTTRIKKLFPASTSRPGGAAYDTAKTARILVTLGRKQRLKVYRNKAIIHFIAATGCRVGAIPDLKFADLEKSKNRYIVKIYTNTRSEYVTFLTKEASAALDQYLQKRKETQSKLAPDSSLFDISYSACRGMITRLVKKAQVVNKQPNGRFDIPAAHGFRKRWNTTLKANTKLNPLLVEKILGHNVLALDEHYNKPTPERLLEEYVKGEKDLTIFRQKKEESIP